MYLDAARLGRSELALWCEVGKGEPLQDDMERVYRFRLKPRSIINPMLPTSEPSNCF